MQDKPSNILNKRQCMPIGTEARLAGKGYSTPNSVIVDTPWK